MPEPALRGSAVFFQDSFGQSALPSANGTASFFRRRGTTRCKRRWHGFCTRRPSTSTTLPCAAGGALVCLYEIPVRDLANLRQNPLGTSSSLGRFTLVLNTFSSFLSIGSILSILRVAPARFASVDRNNHQGLWQLLADQRRRQRFFRSWESVPRHKRRPACSSRAGIPILRSSLRLGFGTLWRVPSATQL